MSRNVQQLPKINRSQLLRNAELYRLRVSERGCRVRAWRGRIFDIETKRPKVLIKTRGDIGYPKESNGGTGDSGTCGGYAEKLDTLSPLPSDKKYHLGT